MIEKRVLFDSSGNPTEIRYYEEDILVARLGIIQDTNGDFIGLKELNPLDVMPLGWVDRFKQLFGNKPKRIDVTTIDFIGLINWINTIKTIQTINSINEIKKIDAFRYASQQSGSGVNVPQNVETTIFSVSGSGHCDCINVLILSALDSQYIKIRVYCDTVLALEVTPSDLNVNGFIASSPPIELLKYAVNGLCSLLLSVNFEFKTSFKVACFTNLVTTQTVTGFGVINLIS